MTQPPSHSPLPELPMCAYYYSFTPTGVRSVDEVLSSVAFAGKAFHDTEQWTDGCGFLDGKSCRDLIQEAAARAASLHDELVGALEEALDHLPLQYHVCASTSCVNDLCAAHRGLDEVRARIDATAALHDRITAALAKAKGGG